MSGHFTRRQVMKGTATVAAGLATASAMPRLGRAADEGVIKIGYVGALTGFLAAWGLPGYYGCQLLTEWYNKAGGIKVGNDMYKLELVAYDDEFDPAKSLVGAKKLVLEDEVSFVIGSYASPVRSMQQFLTDNKMVSTTLVQYDTAPEYPYLISVTEPYPYENLAAGIWFTKAHPDLKKVATCSQNDEVGIYGIASFNAIWETAGMESVYTNIFGTDTTDVAPIVSAMLASKPDVMCWGGSWPDFINLLSEQAYLQGWRGPMIANTCDNYWKIIEKTSTEFLEGYTYPYPDFDDPMLQGPDINFPEPERFYKESEERWPGSWNAVSWLYAANMVLWKAAVEAGGSYQPMDVLATLKAMDPMPLAFGPGKWRGMKENGIDNAAVGYWPAVEIKSGKGTIMEIVNLPPWLDENLDVLLKQYEALGLV